MDPNDAKAGSATEPAFDVTDVPSSRAAAARAGFPPTLDKDVRVWLVRHGETEWSLNGKHTGRSDIPLTENGERQAAALADLLRAVQPVRVLSSPRQRALETARLAGIEVDEVTDELAEWDYGDYEGRTTEEIQQSVPDWTVFTHGCPAGESVAAVQRRADRVLGSIGPWLDDGPVMLFGHGHFSRALGARWVGLPVSGGASLLLGTAAPSVLGADHGAPAIVRWNMPNPAEQAP